MLRRLRRAPEPIDPLLWREVRAAVPWVAALDEARDARLQSLAERFIHAKTITPVGRLQLDARERCMLAAMCCLPVLEFGEHGLDGWSQLIVYPEAFRVHRSHMDAAGVLHEGHEELIGEAWGDGPVILSWADVLADCDDPRAGFCVAAHEIAHKLDLLDGVLDGTPLLPREWQREWARDFQQAFDGFCEQLDDDREPAIDGYAAEAPEEFFAVATEYHFSDPERLLKAMPGIAAHLSRFYGPPPFSRQEPQAPDPPAPG
ncbi:MAG: zinc-dependent peptidase [Lysobacter sp.]|nr:zinc-dependent peptidase [Lysobacter sp.]MDQ3269537.1 zinc-dependent peptidase [Pseudomonadota bacterium]